MTIELPPELASRLRKQAARAGVNVEAYAIKAIESDLCKSPEQSPHCLSLEESRLLREINSGLGDDVWNRYDELVAKRRDETLTPSEHRELIALSDRVEECNVHRLEYVVEYARLKGVPVAKVLKDLGIGELVHV